jgi:hypothetical protein
LLTAWTTDDALETSMLHLFNSMRMKWISRCRKLIVGIVLRAFAWRKSEIERVQILKPQTLIYDDQRS